MKIKFNNDGKHDHSHEDRRPSTYVEGEIVGGIITFLFWLGGRNAFEKTNNKALKTLMILVTSENTISVQQMFDCNLVSRP